MTFRFFYTTSFLRSIRHLKKRYRNINADLTPAFAAIEANPTTGDVIPDDFNIRKIRVASKDMQRGKSGGFRLLYKLTNKEDDLIAHLLYIYAKTDQEDVSSDLLEQLDDQIDN